MVAPQHPADLHGHEFPPACFNPLPLAPLPLSGKAGIFQPAKCGIPNPGKPAPLELIQQVFPPGFRRANPPPAVRFQNVWLRGRRCHKSNR